MTSRARQAAFQRLGVNVALVTFLLSKLKTFSTLFHAEAQKTNEKNWRVLATF